MINIDVEEDKDVASVVENVRNFLVDAPVELTFKIKIKDPKEEQWLDIK